MIDALNSWKQQGCVYLWRYRSNERNYPGFHLSADDDGSRSLAALFELLGGAPAASGRTVAISPPSAAELSVPNNRSAPTESPTRLRVSANEDPDAWQFEDAPKGAVLSVGRAWVPRLVEATHGIRFGRGDFALGGSKHGSMPLWFWWRRAAI